MKDTRGLLRARADRRRVLEDERRAAGVALATFAKSKPKPEPEPVADVVPPKRKRGRPRKADALSGTERTRQMQLRRQARGDCEQCGRRPAAPERRHCKPCATYFGRFAKARRQRLQAAGKCTVCGRRKLSKKSRYACATCRDYFRSYNVATRERRAVLEHERRERRAALEQQMRDRIEALEKENALLRTIALEVGRAALEVDDAPLLRTDALEVDAPPEDPEL